MNNHTKDTYKVQLGFLRASELQSETQRSLATRSVLFWEYGLQSEIRCCSLLAECLRIYQEGFEECYGKFDAQDQISQLLKASINEEQVKEQYSVERVLGKELAQEVAQFMKLEEVRWGDLKDFMLNFELKDFENRILVLKQLDVQREFAPQVYKECRMIVSTDHYLLIFDKSSDQTVQEPKYKKPNISLQFKEIELKKVGPGLLETKVTTNDNFLGKWINQKEVYVFKFKSDDEMEEFAQVVESF